MLRYKVKTKHIAVLLAMAFLIGAMTATPQPAKAISLGSIGDLVKVFGIAWVVDRFAPQINNAVNSGLRQRDAEINGYTKVVPIIRAGLGSGTTAVGAAQVMGPQVQVEKVQAVAEVEIRIIGSVRARGLIPISTRDTRSIKSVGGVGVSANVKFPI